MIKEIEVGEGLVLAQYPYDRDFIGFECPMRSIPTRLRKILFNWIIGVKLIPLLGLNVL
ncbi:hypothetical protein HMPREF1451_00457 [Helicobacter pylori HP260BFii]|uniref:Uncharacterized protein n=1 Tax=Helicobacter pylori GAM260BSi TaxID=1159046 RepID=M3QV57_HELPX|nr:hypothetical protein HMPREF1418_00639 [Helicobacter pylori GAM260BSi]EMH69117.1 hypothetical protein HMPREF1451_00457 [Helicobacter pylori HP260BFii]